MESGDFKTVANHYFSLAKAADAFELARSGRAVGKVVVTIKDDLGQPEQEFANLVAPVAAAQLRPPSPAAPAARSSASSAPSTPVALAPPPAEAAVTVDAASPPARAELVVNLDSDEDKATLANPFGN